MSKSILLKWLFLDFKKILNDKSTEFMFLSVRIASGLIMLFSHGVGKWMNFSKIAPNFPDPFGFLGSTFSLALVVGSEVFGAILLALGLLTRWAGFSLLFTMLTAAFIVHWPDPFKDKELAVLYALVFLFFTVRGGGKYSLDHILQKKLK